MTRPQLDRLFLSLYGNLVMMAERLIPHRGADAVNRAYELMVANDTYKRASRGRTKGRQWVMARVRTEIQKIRDEEKQQWGTDL